ncbi:hypothetical protein [Nitrolancea hollandica]|uniref:Uncharacterized protein n=1 Tax=Nitrolancea hollandica Lb TaxID=1129897 RepID=I4ENF5_9BACT|nr:hypothetical protein [Nitrolancea hollandica]CCF86218.1 hypothetical protein NITHO_90002 [Nitrolancea hollandica Lb]
MSEEQSEQSGQPPVEQASEQPPERPEVQHAEEIVNRMGQRVGEWGTVVRHRLRQGVARAREAGEDILAEAQAISQKQEQK